MPRLFLAAALLAVVACADSPAVQSGLSLDGLPELTLREDARFGHSGNPDSGFSAIGPIDVADDGALFVFDTKDTQIRVFDSAGRRIAAFGRKGPGPGELGSVEALGVIGDTVWVQDIGNRSITFFHRDGRLLRSVSIVPVPIGDSAFRLAAAPVRPRRDGRFEGSANRPRTLSVGTGPSLDTVRVPRLVFSPDGKRADTLGTELTATGRAVLVRAGTESGAVLATPYAAYPVVLAADSLRVLIEQPAPASAGAGVIRISRLDDRDTPVWTREYRYTPLRLDREAAIKRYVEIFFTPQVPRAEAERAMREAIVFPEYSSFASHLASDGTIWLAQRGPNATPGWIVIGPDGTPRGRLVLPPKSVVRAMRVSADRIWIAMTDDRDVPYVARYRIARE